MRRLICVLSLALSLALAACTQPEGPATPAPAVESTPAQWSTPTPESMQADIPYYGSWQVTKSIASAPVAALSKEEIAQFEAAALTYSAERFTARGATTEAPIYQETAVSAESFAQDFKGLTLEELGLSGGEKAVTVTNSQGFGSTFYVKDGNALIVYYEGVFFEAVHASFAPEDTPGVEAGVQIHEGIYFDEGVYGFAGGPVEDTTFTYCEFVVSNVTATSFDFSLNEVTLATDERTALILVGTAYFTGDGMQAVYEGSEATLTFTFANLRQSLPVVVDMQVSGLDVLTGNNYVNNAIPGYEFG